MSDNGRVRKLRWRCRRGMKELDVLLERFLDCHSDALASGQWPALEPLLELEDDVFWDYVQNPSRAPKHEQKSLLAEIRKLRVQAN